MSFSVERGQIVGLLGPNGAGKSTILGMLSGVVRPTNGTVQIAGHTLAGDASPLKKRIGFVPQELALYDELSSIENLRIFGGLYSMPTSALYASIARVLDLVKLSDRAHDRVKGFSGGMKRRLNLAVSLLHDPEILLLDEATAGVDPQSCWALIELFRQLASEGKAIVFSTHHMAEAESLCDHVVILDRGQIVARDTLRNLRGKANAPIVLRVDFHAPPDTEMIEQIRDRPGVIDLRANGGHVLIELERLSHAPGILEHLFKGDNPPTHFESEQVRLESIFRTLTGSTLRD